MVVTMKLPSTIKNLQPLTDLVDKLKDYELVLLNPNRNDSFDFHHFFITRLSEKMNELGFRTKTFSAGDKNFGKDIVSQFSNNKSIHFGIWFYDMHIGYHPRTQMNFFDLFDVPNYALMFDHVFPTWKFNRILGLTENSTVICAISDIEEELRLLNNSVQKYQHIFFPCITEEDIINNSPKMKDREIDLVISWGIYKTKETYNDFRKQLRNDAKLLKFADNFYERIKRYDDIYHIQNFKMALQDVYGVIPQYNIPWSKAEQILLTIIDKIDAITRTETRVSTLENLKKLPAQLKIAITADEGPQYHPNITYIGKQTQKDMQKYFANSRFTLNYNPTYKAVLQERVTYAMSVGCIPIAYPDLFMRENFVHGENIFFTRDFDNLDPEIFTKDDHELQTISDNAKHFVLDNYSLEKYCHILLNLFEKDVRKKL